MDETIVQRSIPVSVTGLPGDLATRIADAVKEEDDMVLAEYGLTGPDQPDSTKIYDTEVKLFGPDGQKMGIEEMKKRYPSSLVILDASKGPMHEVGELYAEAEIPFVFAGTIGDSDALRETIKKSNISAMIAPNISLELNVFASIFEERAKEFPGMFKGYKAKIVESHQKSKKDVSGTARKWTRELETMGMEVEIYSARTEEDYAELGISDDYWDLHGYHWVTIKDPTGHTVIEFNTKIDGRDTYKLGAPRTIRFMDYKTREGSKGEVFGYMDAVRWELGK